MNILQINASARRDGANSTRVANQVTARLQAANPGATLTLRDLAVTPHPLLDEAALGALFTPAANRSAEQAARVALDDALIAEIQAHDTVVLGVPMYNFGVPVQLKSWIDAIARAGVTSATPPAARKVCSLARRCIWHWPAVASTAILPTTRRCLT
jgi:FMN-dependent NADH-azoreductase